MLRWEDSVKRDERKAGEGRLEEEDKVKRRVEKDYQMRW